MFMIGRAYMAVGVEACGACGEKGKHFLDFTVEGEVVHEVLLCRDCAINLCGCISREIDMLDADVADEIGGEE